MKKKTVCILGMGYIGLPTAAFIADADYFVTGVDTSIEIVDGLNKGIVHIAEPNLSELVVSVMARGNLCVQDIPCKADIFIICVPTPLYKGGDKYSPNLTYVEAAMQSIAPLLQSGNLVCLLYTSDAADEV